ncbi:MAG: type II secretion system protein [Planctomycetota bacterium]|jgi:type II secretory pathway pseudopilin PulG
MTRVTFHRGSRLAGVRPPVDAARRGFTIVELLTSLLAIVVLVGLVIHAATSVRRGADRGSEMAAARSLGIAWSSYAMDHRGAILPGYASGFRARDAAGEFIDTSTAEVAAQRWPLRLAPYLGHDFAALYSGPARNDLSELTSGPTADLLYRVSVRPSFGLNGVFVGGDQNFGGFSDIMRQTFGDFDARGLSSVRRPDRLVVFSTSHAADPALFSGVQEGFFRILPPAWTSLIWSDDYDPDDPAAHGFVSPRHQVRDEDVAITTTVDGAVATRTIDELRDLRRWSNLADSADWTMQPIGP